MQRMQAAAEFSGERMLTGLDPETLSTELGTVGLRLRDQINPMQIQARYFDVLGVDTGWWNTFTSQPSEVS